MIDLSLQLRELPVKENSVDFPRIVKLESEDFEIQKSQKQSIAHNSCHLLAV